jgi:hypothetical protein
MISHAGAEGAIDAKMGLSHHLRTRPIFFFQYARLKEKIAVIKYQVDGLPFLVIVDVIKPPPAA